MFSRIAIRGRSVSARTSSFTRSQPVRSISSSSHTKFDFVWADRAKGYPASLIAAYKQASSRINDLKTSSSTDLKVPSIDWAYWEKEIAAPGVVAKLKKEYESQKFNEFSVTEKEIEEKNKFYDEQISLAEGRIAANQIEMNETKEQLKEDEYFYNNPEEFALQDMYRRLPGIEEELRQQFWTGHYNLDPEERKNSAWDPNTMINYFESGGSLLDTPSSLLVPHVPQKIGNFDLIEIVKGIEKKRAALGLPYKNLLAKLPKFREPKDHHELLPLLQQRKDGAPIFGAPVPGQPEGSQN